jgi:hypothetical protein
MGFGQVFPGFGAVLRSLFLAGEVPMQALQLLFRLAKVAGVLDGMALRIGAVGLQAHIDACLLAGGHMFDHALGFHTELHIVAVCTLDEAHAVDVLDREGGASLPAIAD